MAHKIGSECIGCGACMSECPTNCIYENGGVYAIKEAECIDCGSCAGVCPVSAPKPE
ncbi:MAG: 4Fe-4S binding protein [Firmicutes bacterium]|jgi:NAD-dependent dihydropyrimidine dehydrogenase PreA subunit|nr:4Fe-4S binding protein [Bacillota bacterium]